jgi:hypothetical protein
MPPVGSPVTDTDFSHYQGFIQPEEIFADGFEQN